MIISNLPNAITPTKHSIETHALIASIANLFCCFNVSILLIEQGFTSLDGVLLLFSTADYCKTWNFRIKTLLQYQFHVLITYMSVIMLLFVLWPLKVNFDRRGITFFVVVFLLGGGVTVGVTVSPSYYSFPSFIDCTPRYPWWLKKYTFLTMWVFYIF